jgi:hypothetical protein
VKTSGMQQGGKIHSWVRPDCIKMKARSELSAGPLCFVDFTSTELDQLQSNITFGHRN